MGARWDPPKVTDRDGRSACQATSHRLDLVFGIQGIGLKLASVTPVYKNGQQRVLSEPQACQSDIGAKEC